MADFNTYTDADGDERHFKTIDGDGTSGDPAVTGVGILDAAGGAPIGTTTTAAVTSDANGSVIGFLRGLVKWAFERMPSSLGQKTMANSLSVTVASDQTVLATSANQSTELTRLGDVTETAPASDTASSGLNGRLQRIAQRLTGLIGLLPTSLGQKTKANSLAVTLASDEDFLDRVPSSLGQKTKANSLAVTLASDQTVGIGNAQTTVQITGSGLGMSVSSYVNQEVIGNKVTLTGVTNVKATMLVSVILQYAGAALAADVDILIFSADPSASAIADNTTIAINTADVEKVHAVINVAAGDWIEFGTSSIKSFALKQTNVILGSLGNFYACVVAKGAVTGIANALAINFGFRQDG